MATDSGTATKGKRAGGKRGHPPAENNDASRSLKQDSGDTEDNLEVDENSDLSSNEPKNDFLDTVNAGVPQSKKRRSAINFSPTVASPAEPSKEQKPATSPATPTAKSGRNQARTPARGRSAVKVEQVSPVANQASASKPPANPKQNGGKAATEEWNSDDLGKLVENLLTLLPKTDNVKYSTQVERMDWDSVSFDNYSGDDCKEKWSTIMAKLRRYRTLSELVNDAKEWVKHPWMTYNNSKGKVKPPKPPGQPKKPLTPYFRYFMEKRPKYSREHPNMSMTDLAKMLAKKYAELPDKKKMKYKESYDRDNELFKGEMEKYKAEHPDMYPETETKSKSQSKQNGPQKAQTPAQLFLADKISKHKNDTGSNKKELEEKYRLQWKSFSSNKRIRWIKKAYADKARYESELSEYQLAHPDYNPEQKKSTISKAEKEIKDRSDGKPDRPPNSGYSLYSKIMLKELKDIPSKEKMGEISRRWKELSEKERQGYVKKANEAIARYQVEYKSYVSNLTEEERKELEDEEKKKKRKPVSSKASTAAAVATTSEQTELTPSRPKKPMSALFFYQQEKMAQYKADQPDRSEQELTRLIAREYGELSEKKKEKYKKLAEDAKNSYVPPPTTMQKQLKAKLVKTQPKKPPVSGYALFTSEMVPKLNDFDSKKRIHEIARQWRALSNEEQEKYKRQQVVMAKKYQKELAKFTVTLTPEENAVFQQMQIKKPSRRSTKAQATTVKVESSSSSDEESGKDEEGVGEKDNKESSSTDSGSGSGSDSSSDSDESDSDSDSDSKSEESGSDKDDSDDDDDKNEKDSGNSSSGDSDGDSNSASASDSDSEEE